MTKTQLRVNAIRRESGYNQAKPHNIVLLILSNKAKQEQRQPYIPRPSNVQRRVPASRKESKHSYA